MPFERFRGHRKAHAPRVSIYTIGMLHFNKVAVRQFGLDNWSAVSLWFDKETGRVHVCRETDSACGDSGMRDDSLSGRGVSVQAFLDWIDYDNSASRRFDLAEINPGTLEFQITKKGAGK